MENEKGLKKNKVLILIDLQNDFISGSLGSEEAKKIVPNIVKKIKEGDWDKIILTMDTHSENYLDTKEGQKLPVKHCICGTEGWKINKDIVNAVKEKMGDDDDRYDVVAKSTFGSISLPFKIPANTDEIEICGLLTDICVLHNAIILKAYFNDYTEITIDSKCCLGTTKENHEKALAIMKNGHINIK